MRCGELGLFQAADETLADLYLDLRVPVKPSCICDADLHCVFSFDSFSGNFELR